MALQTSEAAILNSSLDPIVVIDKQRAIVLFNPAAEQAFAITAEDVLGRSVEEIFVSPALSQALNGTETASLVEWTTEAGMTFASRLSPVLDVGGLPNGHLLIFHDISAHKEQSQNLRTFVGTLAHDLRSPLTYMQGFASMISMVGTLNEKQKGYQDKIIGGVGQMADLVEKVLDIRKLDPDGNYRLHREPCDVVHMVSEVVSNHVSAAEKKGQKLISDVDQHLPILALDETMLRRALQNLVDNAIKYTPENGTITVAAKTNKDNNTLVLSVKDTGYGISPENQKKLFAQFQRIRRREHFQVKGSGLGLYIVKAVASRHGGSAWVESEEGKGSTFFISLPLEGANLVGAEAQK
ncbi:MAG: PAS domain-containing protein [Anaerolineae bacterium]|nr:PAS domain-containing protein [Anaerolineae bacterium]